MSATVQTDLAAFSAHQRDHELGQSLETGGKIKARDVKRNEAKKKKFFAEVITIVMTDDFGAIMPGCRFKFPRKKFSMKSLKQIMKRCPYPDVDIDYFCDNNGTAFWPEEMLLKALPDPAYYIIVPRMKRKPFDIFDDPTYEGQTVFMVKGVPSKSKDNRTVVTVETMKEWILFGIVEEDPSLKKFKVDIQEAKDYIAAVDKKIRGVSKLHFKEPDGSDMPAKKAEVERDILYKAYNDERHLGEKQLKIKTEAFSRFVDWRRKMNMSFVLAGHDVNTDTNSYYIRFSGLADAKEMENLLLKKEDWSGVKLACGTSETEPLLPVWVGRGQVPGSDDNKMFGDYRELQVNVAGCRFLRVPHGVGTLRKLDRESSTLAAERFEYYYGDWEAGKKMGHGIEVDDSGVYCGRFIDGQRDGYGKWDLADGTTFTGNFGQSAQFKENKSGEFDNPYREGCPHGEVEILFGDGAFYRGQAHNGRIQGYGEYQSGFGEVKVGSFLNGMLHGENCMHINLAGEKYVGKWDLGEVDGEAHYSNKRGDTYVGFFDHNLRHGRGVAYFAKKGRYRGYYCNGLISGKGELQFGIPRKAKKKKEEETAKEKDAFSKKDWGEAKQKELDAMNAEVQLPPNLLPPPRPEEVRCKVSHGPGSAPETKTETEAPRSEFRKCFMGYFLADDVLNGGALMDIDGSAPRAVARMDKRTTLPILAVLRNNLLVAKRLRRKLEKFTDMEMHVRAEIVKKKRRIYNQQKHFTKKTIYDQDQYENVSKDAIVGRQRVRDDRLARLDMDRAMPKRAMIPRLAQVSDQPVRYLTDEFKLIKPDPENGDVKTVKKLIPRIVMSDMEEAKERQRLILYDKIWERAEEAFVKNKRSGEQVS